MRNWKPSCFILPGFVLVMAGFALPFLMVLQVIPSTFFLDFLAYAASFTGLLLVNTGSALYTAASRSRRNRYP
jgi:hypothetical protein